MKSRLPVILIILLLSACTEQFMVIDTPPSVPSLRRPDEKPRVALVLGGGAFHGIAHLGVIKVLEQEGIPIDLIVGASAGSLVGCMYADNPHADSLIRLIRSTKASDVFDFSLFRSRVGFVSGKKLQTFIAENCKAKRIEDTRIPFIAMVTDLINGKSIALSSGPMAPAINASCAIPMVFEPVKMYGLTLVDGGILDNIPTDIAHELGAQVIIAVDVMAGKDTVIETDNFAKIGLRALMLMADELKAKQLTYADIVITPDLTEIPYMSGKHNQAAYDAGVKATSDNLKSIRKVLDQKGLKLN